MLARSLSSYIQGNGYWKVSKVMEKINCIGNSIRYHQYRCSIYAPIMYRSLKDFSLFVSLHFPQRIGVDFTSRC